VLWLRAGLTTVLRRDQACVDAEPKFSKDPYSSIHKVIIMRRFSKEFSYKQNAINLLIYENNCNTFKQIHFTVWCEKEILENVDFVNTFNRTNDVIPGCLSVRLQAELTIKCRFSKFEIFKKAREHVYHIYTWRVQQECRTKHATIIRDKLTAHSLHIFIKYVIAHIISTIDF